MAMRKLMAAVTLWLTLGVQLQPGVFGQAITPPNGEDDSRLFASCSGTKVFPDTLHTETQTWEIIYTGTPATVNLVISGVMPGGTTTVLLTDTNAVNHLANTSGGPFSSYSLSSTCTGGTSPTLLVNRRASTSKQGGAPSGGFGFPQGYGQGGAFAGIPWPIDATQYPASTALAAGPGCPYGSAAGLSNDPAGQIQEANSCNDKGSTIVYWQQGVTAYTIASDPYVNPSDPTGQTLTRTMNLYLGPGHWSSSVPIGLQSRSTLHGTVPSPNFYDLSMTSLEWTGGDQVYVTDNGLQHTLAFVCLGPTGNEGANNFCFNGGNGMANNPAEGVYTIKITCQGAKNMSGLIDNTGEELTTVQFVTVGDCSYDAGGGGLTHALQIGTRNDANSAENSGSFGPMNIFYGQNCTASSIPVMIGSSTSGEASVVFAPHITLNGGSGCSGTPGVAISVQGAALDAGDLHIQNATIGLKIGAGNGTPASHIGTISCTSDVGTCVSIVSGNSAGGSIAGVMCQSGCSSYTLVDNSTSPVTQLTGDVGLYVMGEGYSGSGGTWYATQFSIPGGAFAVNASGNATVSELTSTGTVTGTNVWGTLASEHLTGQNATKSLYTLCTGPLGPCLNAGQYRITWYFTQGGTACTTVGSGGVTFALTWTDLAGAHSAVLVAMVNGATPTTLSTVFGFQTSNTAAYASGQYTIWSTGTADIKVTNTMTACTTGSSETWELDATVERIQ